MNTRLWGGAFVYVAALLVPVVVRAQAPPEAAYRLPNVDRNFAAAEATATADVKEKLRAIRAKVKSRFSVGYTSAMDVPIEVLAATRIPRELPEGIRKFITVGPKLREIDAKEFAQVERLHPNLKALSPAACSASLKSWDWRRPGKVTEVRAQICGTCWDFTAMGTYEGSYAIRNGSLVDASEQYILNCAGAGTCKGGWWGPVFAYMITNGTATEAADPFDGNDTKACPTTVPTPYRASAWSFVNTAHWDQAPSPDAMKLALCEHGPIATAVFVDDTFQAYTGGTFDETGQAFDWINHGIVIIGWDDTKQAWLIKNSWGKGWGETGGFGSNKGYMWIKYGSNNIGIATAWVDAARAFYKLPAYWERILEEEKILIKKPLPEPDDAILEKLQLKVKSPQ
jgi:cathepsin L